jgi:glycerol-3-phosphate dehydrogenase
VSARQELLDRVRSGQRWDLVVTGGGATGLGAAVDAAARGFRVLLLEAHDFAKGTSSRSTKLVHGGVRYLAQGRIGLVWEALHERGLLLRNAPHVAHVLPFLLPVYGRLEKLYYGLGLGMYDLLAGRLGLGHTRWLGRAESLERAPTLNSTGLTGGLLYNDGQFDDARLAIALVRTLLDLGGTALNYAPVTGLLKAAGRVAGVEAVDAETGERLRIEAKAVINATGVFADEVRRLDDPAAAAVIAPSQGVHLVLDRPFLPGESAVLIPRTDDGRVLFAIPWHDRVILGTTDTPVERSALEPRALPGELAFLVEHAEKYFGHRPAPQEIRSVYAGLRPLVRSSGARKTAELSRSHKILISRSGLVTIIGGKWTTYRRMAEDVVGRAMDATGLPPRRCTTENLKLHGWTPQPADGPWTVYGSDAPAVRSLLEACPDWKTPLHPALPYRAGEVVWAARFELARTVEDVLARRTRALLLDARASQQAAAPTAALLAQELGFSSDWQQSQVRQFHELADQYIMK